MLEQNYLCPRKMSTKSYLQSFFNSYIHWFTILWSYHLTMLSNIFLEQVDLDKHLLQHPKKRDFDKIYEGSLKRTKRNQQIAKYSTGYFKKNNNFTILSSVHRSCSTSPVLYIRCPSSSSSTLGCLEPDSSTGAGDCSIQHRQKERQHRTFERNWQVHRPKWGKSSPTAANRNGRRP